MTLRDLFDDKAWQTLQARAKRAQKSLQTETAADALEVLLIQAQQMRVAMPVATIIGVQDMVSVVLLPGAPVWVAGLVNWRGQLLTVLDLAALLQLPPDVNAQGLVVVTTGEITVGLRVTQVLDVTRLQRRDLLAATVNLDTPHAGFYLGVLPDSTAVLNMDLLLNDPSLLIEDAE